MKFLPHFLYESLPYLYTLIGLIAALKVPGKLGVASGVLLLSIGLLVFKMRMSHRAQTKPAPGRRA